MNLMEQSKGELITSNNFLSTSTDRNVSAVFAKNATTRDTSTRVLFEFEIDTRLKDAKPYADISKLSCIPGEAEILIMLGSVFKIEEVEFSDAQKMWITKLSLCSESSFELKDLIKQMKEETLSTLQERTHYKNDTW
jgi:hypothetical protein